MSEVPLYTPRLFWMQWFTSAPVEGWGLGMRVWGYRFRAKREQSKTFQELLSKSQGQNLALTVACVPCSLDSGLHACHAIMLEEVARSICSHISARLAYIQEESGILLASVQIKGRENAIRSSSEGRWPICDRPAMCARPREGGNACSVACGGGWSESMVDVTSSMKFRQRGKGHARRRGGLRCLRPDWVCRASTPCLSPARNGADSERC